ncbi:MAG: glycosyltransferase family 4 protein [Candidatus Binatia bacterium]
MKIALAHKQLDLGGGTERDFYRTAEGLRDLGHEVHLFCGEFRVPPPEGTRAHKVPSLPLGRTARLLSLAFLSPRIIRRHMCDVVVGFGRMVQQDILRSGGGSHRVFLQKMEQGGGVRRRLWHRFSIYHRSALAVERLQYHPRNYKKILAVSQEVKREIMTTYHVPEEKVSVIYNGVDHERFHPSNRGKARQRIRRQWGIPPEAPLVLFVGSGFQRKGLDRLLNVWESPRLAGIYLLVVGEDAQRNRYSSWADRQTKGRIVFAGRQSEVENYYGAADLLALPAFQEAFGNVVLEALASGLPVLAAKTVGAAEVLTGELEEGILAYPDDPSEIERKIISMLERDRWEILSRQARRLGENHSWKDHFHKLESYLLEVAEMDRRGAFS